MNAKVLALRVEVQAVVVFLVGQAVNFQVVQEVVVFLEDPVDQGEVFLAEILEILEVRASVNLKKNAKRIVNLILKNSAEVRMEIERKMIQETMICVGGLVKTQ